MRIVLQRVVEASVEVEGKLVSSIGRGILALVGIGQKDNEEILKLMAKKLVNLRIFPDREDKMNLSLLEIGGELLCISQFTLYANCRKGRRPSFTDAMPPREAEKLFEQFVDILREYKISVGTGIFGAMMNVSLINEGPVTIILDSEELLKPRRQS